MKIFPTYLLFTYRNTIGDLDAPVYSYWVSVSTEHPYIAWTMITSIWCVWLINQWTLLVIVFNLQIAIIGKTYSDITGNQIVHKYQYQCEMNKETCLLFSYLGILVSVDCFILSSSVDSQNSKTV